MVNEQQAAVVSGAHPDPVPERAGEQVDPVSRQRGQDLADGGRAGDTQTAACLQARGERRPRGRIVHRFAAPRRWFPPGDNVVRRTPDRPAHCAYRPQVIVRSLDAVEGEHRAEPARDRRTTVQQLELGQRPVPAGVAEVEAGPSGAEPPGVGRAQPGEARSGGGTFLPTGLRTLHGKHYNRLHETYLSPDTLLKNPAFSQLVVVREPSTTIYVGGQNGITKDGQLAGETIGEQVTQALINVELALAAADASIDDVVRWTIWLVQGQDVREAFGAFRKQCPALETPPTIPYRWWPAWPTRISSSRSTPSRSASQLAATSAAEPPHAGGGLGGAHRGQRAVPADVRELAQLLAENPELVHIRAS